MVKVDGLPCHCNGCKLDWMYHGRKKPSVKYVQYVACPRCHSSVKIGGKNG